MESPLDLADLEPPSAVAIVSYPLSGEERGRDDVEEVRDFVKACFRESILVELESKNHSLGSDDMDIEEDNMTCCIIVVDVLMWFPSMIDLMMALIKEPSQFPRLSSEYLNSL